MSKFSKFNLSDTLYKSLKSINFITPTPIQEKSIPIILDGNDILGSAQTGTGKTAAYAIPIIDLLLKSKKSSVLILIPTRELAKQVLDVVRRKREKEQNMTMRIEIENERVSKN